MEKEREWEEQGGRREARDEESEDEFSEGDEEESLESILEESEEEVLEDATEIETPSGSMRPSFLSKFGSVPSFSKSF